MIIQFTVPGPAVGKGRPRFSKRGNFVRVHTPEKTVSYENLVKILASQAMERNELIDGPVTVNMQIYVGVPQSWSKKKKEQALKHEIMPTTKPDIDNVLKSICDAMNSIVFVDDKQIVETKVSKFYSEKEAVSVTVTHWAFN